MHSNINEASPNTASRKARPSVWAALLRGGVRRFASDASRYRILRYVRHLISPSASFEVAPGILIHAELQDWFVQSLFIESKEPAGLFHRVLRAIEPGGTVVDVGGNVGSWSLLAAARAGSAGRVVAFEPHPRNRERFQRNLRLNGFEDGTENVTIEPYALSDSPGEATFYESAGDNSGLGRLAENAGVRAAFTTQVDTLDAALARLGITPQLIKIDVEGAEMNVLRGASKTLAQVRPLLMFEFNPALARDFHADGRALEEFLAARGYKLFRWELGRLVAADLSGATEHDDYLAVRSTELPTLRVRLTERFQPGAVPARTRTLNRFRVIFRQRHLERGLALLTGGRLMGGWLSKLPANHYQYPAESWRQCRRGGRNFEVDISDLVGWYTYFGFRDLSHEALLALCNPGAVVLDVGANIGVTALLLAERARQVYAFEPDALNLERLRRHMELNATANVEVVPCALGRSSGWGEVAVRDAANRGMNQVRPGEGRVRIRTLDDFVQEKGLARVDLVKIDVEGGELNVLHGAAATLARCKPMLFVEVNPEGLAAFQQSSGEMIALLKSYGYRIRDAATGAAVEGTGQELAFGDLICD